MATHADSSANDVALCQAADEPELLEPTIAEPGIFKTEICARCAAHIALAHRNRIMRL